MFFVTSGRCCEKLSIEADLSCAGNGWRALAIVQKKEIQVKRKSAVLLLLVFWLSASPVFAQKKVIVSSNEGSADTLCGLAVMQEAYKRIGYEIEMRWLPAGEALEQSNSGVVDAELQRIDGITKEFKNLIQVPIPMNFIQGAVFTKSVSFSVNGWNSLRPYRIGIVKGILFVKQGTAGMDVTEVDLVSDLLGMLEDGTVDIGVMPRLNGLVVARNHNIRELEGVLECLFLYHYVHKKNKALVPLLQKELKNMLLDGTLKRLRDEKYAEILGEE